MREIKFRARNANLPRCWIYGYFVFEDGGNYIINDEGKFKVIAGTEGQYTNLPDKNGKEIYEGDIIQLNNPFRFISSKSKLKEVIFYDGAFYLKAIDRVDTDLRLRQDNIKINHLIVIGNIYQDTEFLK